MKLPPEAAWHDREQDIPPEPQPDKLSAMTRRYLQLALPSPLRQTFDYILPAKMDPPPPVGARVRVPFGKQTLTGIVLAITEHASIDESRLRPAEEALDNEPVLPDRSQQSMMP